MNLDRILPLVRQEIAALGREFRHAPACILTEEDLRGHLFSRFNAIPALHDARDTADHDVLGTAVHANFSWFDDSGRLNLRPDLTVLSPSRLSIYRSLQPGHLLPRKGAHAYGDAILIELKFFHERVGVPRTAVARIHDDYNKICTLVSRNRRLQPDGGFAGIVVVFARYDGVPDTLQELLTNPNSPDVSVVYESARLPRLVARRAYGA